MTKRAMILAEVLGRQLGNDGPGPITSCQSLVYTYNRDAAGSFTAIFAASDPMLKLIALKNTHLRFIVDGERVFTGLVERRKRRVKAGHKTVTLMGRCQLGVLSETYTANLIVSDGAGGPTTDAPAMILATSVVPNQSFQVSFTEGYGDTLTGYYKQLSGESTLKALVDLAEDTGEHFRASTDVNHTHNVVWMRKDTPAAPVRLLADGGPNLHQNEAVALIEELDIDEDATKHFNRIYVYGAGNGAARLDLSASTYVIADTNYDVDRAASLIEYLPTLGPPFSYKTCQVEFKQLRVIENTDDNLESASNALLEAGYNWLRRCNDPDNMRAYKLTVRGLPDSVTVGMAIPVHYQQDNFDIDDTLVILSITREVDDKGSHPARLTVVPFDWYDMSEAGQIAKGIERAKVYSAHPQATDNSDSTAYRVFVGEDQADDKAEVRWWHGDEIIRIRRVLVRFNLSELVTFASTVGGTALTTESGGGATVTSTEEVPVTTHFHDLDFKETATTPAGYPVYVDPVEGLQIQNGGSGTTQQGVTGGADLPLEHDHDVDIPPHSHPVDISGAVSNSFGIFRAAGADTFSIDDLEFSVNGLPWVALNTAASAGGGWHKLDITADLIDLTTRRPLQVTNTWEVRRAAAGATGKTGMLDVTINVLSEIQAIEYA